MKCSATWEFSFKFILEVLMSKKGKLPDLKNVRKKGLNVLLLETVLLAMSWKSFSYRFQFPCLLYDCRSQNWLYSAVRILRSTTGVSEKGVAGPKW